MIVKICGITRPDDALAARDAGADWIGLNFVAGPRLIEVRRAEAIVTAIGHARAAVALIRWSAAHNWPEALAACLNLGVRTVQVYGEPDRSVHARLHANECSVIQVRHLHAPAAASLPAGQTASEGGPDFLLLDSSESGKLGGTGLPADWAAIAQDQALGIYAHAPPILLAGGLHPLNVAEAIRIVRPDGVDVSSGVESAPGIKDAGLMREFVRAAQGARAS